MRGVATLSMTEYNNHGTKNVLFLHGIMGKLATSRFMGRKQTKLGKFCEAVVSEAGF